jgi:uncharacterized membrane protein YdbT with pleckstrin-like domain
MEVQRQEDFLLHPKMEQEPLSEEERLDEVLLLAPSVLSEAPRLLLFAVLLAFGIWFSAAYPFSVLHFEDPQLSLTLHIPILLIPAVILGVMIAHALMNERYTVGKDYLRIVRGLLSVHKSDLRVKAHDIRGVDIERSLFGRVLNTGDIIIGSALNGEMVFRLRGIVNPSIYRDVILERAERELQRITHEERQRVGGVRYPAVRE